MACESWTDAEDTNWQLAIFKDQTAYHLAMPSVRCSQEHCACLSPAIIQSNSKVQLAHHSACIWSRTTPKCSLHTTQHAAGGHICVHCPKDNTCNARSLTDFRVIHFSRNVLSWVFIERFALFLKFQTGICEIFLGLTPILTNFSPHRPPFFPGMLRSYLSSIVCKIHLRFHCHFQAVPAASQPLQCIIWSFMFL